MSTREIVEAVYLEILERPADAAGLESWVAKMDDPEDPLNTEEELIAIFKQSKEYNNLQLEKATPCSSLNDKFESLNDKLDKLISKNS